jgi:phosphatidylserine decarboxylase
MRSTLFVWLQYLLPQRLLGRIVGAAAESRHPLVSAALIRWFAWQYAVDLDDAENPDLQSFASFNAFFTRALRTDARPLAPGDATLLAPADGRVTEFGTAVDGQALQAKGQQYRLTELLGEPPPNVDPSTLGDFVTIYLAPYDYHRVHAPLTGALLGVRYVPGRRYSVNSVTARAIPRLFCRNERLIAWFDTLIGPVAVVLVGALNVAGLSTPWQGAVRGKTEQYWDGRALCGDAIARGAEIGRFNLGSTVVVVLPSGSAHWDDALAPEQTIRMGERLGTVAGTASQA